MDDEPLVSIVIDNYNYARFLPAAIESALAQTYRRMEVIVVDDGSTDESWDVIERYAASGGVKPVLKSNGGQGSAVNAGFATSRGEAVLFLDSDDLLLPTAIERAVPFFSDREVAKVHWPLLLADADGKTDGKLYPAPLLAKGDLRQAVLRTGPTHHLSAPTSGNVWARWFLDRVLPLPQDLYRNGCDTCLFETAPFFGTLGFVAEPMTIYRQHGVNDHASFSMADKVERELRFYGHYSGLLAELLPQARRGRGLARLAAELLVAPAGGGDARHRGARRYGAAPDSRR